jgi:hypothetical protein
MNNSFSKIQTGCFARITSIRNKGALVHVGRFLGVVKDWMYDDHWVIDKPIYSETTSEVVYHISSRYLDRIYLDHTPCGKSWDELMKEIKEIK